jgi:tetratricopeptide (TPR) repeat protein
MTQTSGDESAQLEPPGGRRGHMPLDRLVSAAVIALALASTSLGCAGTVPLPPKAIALNAEGAAALSAGDLPTAAAKLAVALEYSPKFTEAWVNLGLVEMRRGNLDLAKTDLEKATDLNPDLPAPWHALGLLADERGKGKEAESSYAAALRVDPGFAPARANLARRMFARGAFDEAKEQYLRLTFVAPEALEGWVGLVESYWRLSRETEADETVAKARARFGDRPELILLMGRQLLRRRDFVRAEAVLAPLTESLVDRSRSAAAWSWIAVARMAREDLRGARAATKEALALDPSNQVAQFTASEESLLRAPTASGTATTAGAGTRFRR